MVRRRLDALRSPARNLLEHICVASEPISRSAVQQACGLEAKEFLDIVQALRSGHFVRSASGQKENHVEPYHDRIREIAVAGLSAERRKVVHVGLAVALDASGHASHERLARHWRGAENNERAAIHAQAAAVEAAASTDFDRAAGWYRTALDLGDHQPEDARHLWIELGEALGNAGRPIESAQAYEHALVGADRTLMLELRRRSMEQLLGGGYVGPGVDAARALLAEVGESLPGSPLATVARLLGNQISLKLRGLAWKARPESEISADALARTDITLTVGSCLSIADSLRAFVLNTRGLRLALRLGNPERVARGAVVTTCSHAALGNARRAGVFRAVAESAAAQGDNPLSWAYAVGGARMFTSFFVANDWPQTLADADEGLEWFRKARVGRSWERDALMLYRTFARYYRGHLRLLEQEVSEQVRSAARSGNRFMEVTLRTAFRILHLVKDGPEAALADMADAIASWIPSRDVFQVQHWYALWGRCEVALYTLQPEEARRDLEEHTAALKRSMLLRIARLRCEHAHLHGRIALAAAVETEDARQKIQCANTARQWARKLERERIPLGERFALLLRAGAARVEGDHDTCAKWLRRAVDVLVESETMLYAVAAKHQLGITLGGDEGTKLRSEADDWMRGEGIANSARMTAMLVPGWHCPVGDQLGEGDS
jgi:hypothetical protein